MTIFNNANNYYDRMEWAQNLIKENGYGYARRIKEALDAAIAKLERLPKDDPGLEENDLEKMKDSRDALIIVLGRHRVYGFIAPGVEAIKRVKKHGEEQRKKRSKRQTWKGITQDQIEERNRSIITAFNNSRRKAGFAERVAGKYGLQPRQIRNIIKKAVGN